MSRTHFSIAALLVALAGLCAAGKAVAVSYAYMPGVGANAVFVYNADFGALSTVIPVGTAPKGVAVHPAGNRVYVSNSNSASVSIIDPLTFTVVATVPVGSGPFGVAINSAGTRVYVANQTDDTVSVIDTGSDTVIATVTVGDQPAGIAVNPTNGEVYVSNHGDGTVSVIAPVTNTVIGLPIAVGSAPNGLAVTPSGTHVYVANQGTNTVSVIDAATHGTLAPITVGNNPYAVAAHPTNGFVYVTVLNGGDVAVIDAATRTIATVLLDVAPASIASQPDGALPMTYVTHVGSPSLYAISSLNAIVGLPATPSLCVALGNFMGPQTILYRPGAPSNVSASGQDGGATVSFTASADGGFAVTSYTVTSTPGGITASGSTSPIHVSGLSNGTAYTFTMRATNANGASPLSSTSNQITPSSAPTVPGSPTNVGATGGAGSATVTFDPPASDGGTAITLYVATASPGGAQASGSVSPIMFSGLPLGATYTFTVHATNAVGDGPESAASTGVAMPSVPEQIVSVSISGGDQQATITFTPPSDGGTAITGYEVLNESQTTVIASGDHSPIVVTGLSNGTTYLFYLRAVNAVGNGPSSTLLKVLPAGLPQAPADAVSTVTGDRVLNVTCSTPSSDLPVTDYIATSSPDAIVRSSGSSVCGITFDNLTAGTAYSFKVKATSAAGTGPESVASAPVVAATLPGAPGGVVAVGGSTQAAVSFLAPVSDGFSPIIDYTVRTTEGLKVFTATGTGSPIVLGGLTNLQSYVFTVSARNAAGSGPESVASNSVTPMPTTPDAPQNVRAMGGDARATLSFLPPANDGGGAIISYTATSSPGGFTGTASGSPIDVTGLANESSYTFTIAATNGTGTGTPSAASNSVTALALVTPAVEYAYITNFSDNLVAVIDTATNRVVNTIRVGSGPSGVAATATRVYVTNSNAGTVSVIDRATSTVVATVSVGAQPNAIAVNPPGTRAFVANNGSNNVSVIDTGSNSVIATLAVGALPIGVAIDPSSSIVYVTCAGAAAVYRFDGNTNAFLGSTGIALGIGGVLATSARVYVGSGLAPTLHSSAGGGTFAPIALGGVRVTFGIGADPTTGRVYVARPASALNTTGGNGGVTAIDGISVGSTTMVGAAPRGVSITSTGRVYVANQASHDVSVLDSATGNLIDTIPVGLSPIAFGNFIAPALASVPGPPGGIAASAGNAQATVTFTAAASNGSAIISYTATSAPEGRTATGNSSPLTVTGLTNDMVYAFTVHATNAVGSGPESTVSNSVVPRTVPGAPRSVIASPGNQEATITFLAPLSDNGAAITSYTATCIPGGFNASAASSPITVTGLANGVQHSCSVTATNAAGTGPASAPANVTPAFTAAPAITSPNAVSFPVYTPGTFTVTASGAPAPTLSMTGTLPTGVTFSPSTGVLTAFAAFGTTGSYPLSFKASNGVGGDATQSFTLTIAKANQAIIFTGPGARTLSTTPLSIAASASASSGLGVTFTSATPTICTVSGTNVTMLLPGTCTISASQAGNGDYNAAAPVQRSFTINAPDRMSNISTRMQVLTGNDRMIAGFIIGGSAPKTVVINVAGPSLAPFGITNALADPTLTLVQSSDQSIIATNDDWQAQTVPADVAALSASGFQPNHVKEPAIIATLPPGAYTAIVSGVGNTTGVGLVGVFEVDHPEIPLANISTRGQVLTNNDVMIAGFIVQGENAKTVVINVAGPSLVPFGITNALANPTLTIVRSSDQSIIAGNDDWQAQTNPADVAAILATGFQPNDPREPAVILTLQPGAYTAIVQGVGGTTGVGLVGVFAVP
jgi:YVTN family beta-propeller protein